MREQDMSAEWYYTTNKQQMGPVTWNELRELADVGILKPHDLIWSDGMDEWVKAINQNGLFADSDAETATTAKKKSAYVEPPKPPPGRRTRRAEEEDDEEDDEDEKEKKRRNRKKEQERAKMGVGIKVGLILAGVLFLLVVGVGCIGGIIWISVGGFGGGQPAGPVHDSYTINNLPVTLNGADHRTGNIKTYNFTQGRRVVITVTNQLQFNDTDVDLYVHRGNDPNPTVMDINVPQFNRNCRVEFVVPQTGQYRVRVVNIGPRGVATRCQVRVDEN
jgi:hypothetical protein